MRPHWKIPVIKRAKRFDACVKQFVHKISVKIETLFIDDTSFRHHTGPADRETVSLQTYIFHERDIFAEAVIVVTGNITVVPMRDMTCAQRIPYARSFAVFVICAFYLICRAGSSP